MEAQTVEEWIAELLKLPEEELKLRSFDRGATWEAVAALRRRVTPATYSDHRIPDDLLLELHARLRNCSCEGAIWNAVILNIPQSLPAQIAHDLLNRQIAVNALGHSRQVDEVQWRMAEFYPEALITLAIDFYSRPERSLDEFQSLLQRFPDYHWMLTTLSLRSASSTEKERAYFDLVERHPDREVILRKYHQKLQEKQAREATDPEEITTFYATQVPHILRGLASNPRTPIEMLQEMLRTKGTKLAKDIRVRARMQLEARRKRDTL